MHAVVGDHAVFELSAERLKEFFVILAVGGEHGGQLALDLLLDILRDGQQVTVVLQHFSRNIQRQIGGVHDALDKAEVLRHQLLAVVGDQHTAGIELQALFVFLGVVIIGRRGRDEQQRLVGHNALHRGHDGLDGLVHRHEFFLIELVVLLLCDVLLRALPDRHHGVQGLALGVVLILGLVAVLGFFLDAALGHIHHDRIADIIGIALHQAGNAVLLQEFVVALVLGVVLEGEGDLGAETVLLTFLNFVAVGAGGIPSVGGVGAVFFGDDSDFLRHHKRRIEAYAELTDDVDIVLLLLHLLLEFVGAGGGDGAEVVFQIVLVHADAVVGDGQRARVLVGFDLDLKIRARHAELVVGQRDKAELVDRVAGVGDDLTQENLLVRVDGIDHQIQQPLGFGLEFFFCHVDYFLL